MVAVRGAREPTSVRERMGMGLSGRPSRVKAVDGCSRPFCSRVGRGLLGFLGEDRRVRVLASDLEFAARERIVVRDASSVAIIDEPEGSSILMRLQAAQPAAGAPSTLAGGLVSAGLVDPSELEVRGR
jgi:hypothetical protein